MKTRTYDPLSYIPSPDVLRKHLADTEELARRLRILLDTSERIHAERSDGENRSGRMEVSHAAD